MTEVKFRIRRLEDEHKKQGISNEEFNEMKRSEHQQRSEVIHAVASGLGLKVKDWSQVDTQELEKMREEINVDFIIKVGELAATAITVAVSAFKVWTDAKKIQNASIHDGKRWVLLEGITVKQLKSVSDELGRSKPGSKSRTKPKPKGRAKDKVKVKRKGS